MDNLCGHKWTKYKKIARKKYTTIFTLHVYTLPNLHTPTPTTKPERNKNETRTKQERNKNETKNINETKRNDEKQNTKPDELPPFVYTMPSQMGQKTMLWKFGTAHL